MLAWASVNDTEPSSAVAMLRAPCNQLQKSRGVVIRCLLAHESCFASARCAPRPSGARLRLTLLEFLDSVVAGESAGAKLAKAQDLGVEVLDEAAFRVLLEGSADVAD